MSIDNKIEDSKQKAIKLGIFQLMQDVVQNTPDPDAEKSSGFGGMFSFDRTIEWEGCEIRYWSSGLFPKTRSGGTITKSDGTVLFHGCDEIGSRGEVVSFRFGAWVERLKAHVKQLKKSKELAEKQQAESEDAEKIEPFGDVDF